jgi:hypothetical protein
MTLAFYKIRPSQENSRLFTSFFSMPFSLLNGNFSKTFHSDKGTSSKKEAKINLLRNFVKELMNNRKISE